MAAEADTRLEEAKDSVNMTSLDGAGPAPAADASTHADASTAAPVLSTSVTPSKPNAVVASNAAVAGSSSSAVPNMGDKEHEREMDEEQEKERQKNKDSLSIEPANPSRSPSNSNPICQITLLLPTSARHPYRIDEKYLSKRNVTTPELTEDGKMDPFSISVYTLKELILREWRPEWDTAPASPVSIRLIYFGKLLDDKMPLSGYNFSPDTSNIVHMTIRPAEIEEEDPAKGGKTSAGSMTSRGGCGCCIVQ